MAINFFPLKIRNRAIFCFFLISIIFPIISITLHRATCSIVMSPINGNEVGQQTLVETLQSIREQSFKNFVQAG